jgi:hypothetical protein
MDGQGQRDVGPSVAGAGREWGVPRTGAGVGAVHEEATRPARGGHLGDAVGGDLLAHLVGKQVGHAAEGGPHVPEHTAAQHPLHQWDTPGAASEPVWGVDNTSVYQHMLEMYAHVCLMCVITARSRYVSMHACKDVHHRSAA